jgi:hypothetical protein
MIPKPYRIEVYGKPGCEKCSLLKKRLDGLLKTKEWQAFEKIYYNVESIDGLVAFTQVECLNPSRIPGFVITKWNNQIQGYEYIPQNAQDIEDNFKRTLLHMWLGLQTDYSEIGKGTLPPKLIEDMLQRAKNG